MENLEIYEDIRARTDGDIYVGVVGPVRTGKSTFIKNFMDLLVIPNIENSYKKERAREERTETQRRRCESKRCCVESCGHKPKNA